MGGSRWWAEVARVYAELRWERVREELGVSTTRGGRWRCGLCGRSFAGERSLLKHAAKSHPREYRRAVRSALVALTLRYGSLPRWFVKQHAPLLLGRGERGSEGGAGSENA
jgi:uncharacterized C2H2 Zn-finger protein